MKKCKECDLQLPPDHRKSYCVSPKHACWCDDRLNKWRKENKIITNEYLSNAFFKSIGGHIVIE